jgi:crotonobetainyl-CoA:carnitine CoA-transferase CaiB-like acyl-CoA transferase
MTAPLEGIRVLELGQFITAPYAAMLLADLGAQTIKVERPGSGDPFRQFREGDYSPNFCGYNRNKRSLTLDLSKPEGAAVLLRAVAQSDVLIENFRPGVMERMGLDWETLRAANPRLVYCGISGFSSDGPLRDRPAYDLVGQAMSGMLGVFLDPADPRVTGPTISDQVTGFYACYGVLGSLLRRARDGTGAKVEVAMMEATMSFMPDFFAAFTQAGIGMQPQTRAAFSHSFAFVCADGKLLAVQLSSLEKFWTALLEVTGLETLANDARFARRMARIANFDALILALRPTFATRTRALWMAALADADVPFAPVNTIEEAMRDPEALHLGSFIDLLHPRHGRITALRRPVRIDGEREQGMLPPPALGEHTDEVLASFGFKESEIGDLRGRGLI